MAKLLLMKNMVGRTTVYNFFRKKEENDWIGQMSLSLDEDQYVFNMPPNMDITVDELLEISVIMIAKNKTIK